MIELEVGQVARAIGSQVDDAIAARLVRRVNTDSRLVEHGDLFVAIRGKRFDGHRFIPQAVARGATACIADGRWGKSAAPNANETPCLIVDDTVTAMGGLASYYRRDVITAHTTVVGITGSNGKTTTKYMLDHVLQASLLGRASPKSFNNAIGVPLTLLSSDREDRYLIVEIGTSAPGEVAALAAMTEPDVAVITSVGEAHLEGLRGIDEVAIEKTSLLDHVRPGGLGVVNVDAPATRSALNRSSNLRLVTYGADPSAARRVMPIAADLSRTIFELDGRYRIELPMPGPHHAANATAVFLVARWFGLDPAVIIERLRSFVPPVGRTRRIDLGGVTLIDDAYNANPASMAAAIDALRCETNRRRVFVMGDMLEMGTDAAAWHRRIARAVVDARVEVLVAVGSASCDAARAVIEPGGRTEVVCCADTNAACEIVPEFVRSGDVVWIKGSRAIGLDRLVERLRVTFGAKAAVA